jgi:hypothetical protein
MSVQLVYTMRSLVESVESPVLLDWFSSRLVSSTSPTSPTLQYFTDITASTSSRTSRLLRGRDQQPGYFNNITDFINISATASPASARRATPTTTSACSSSILIIIKSMFELSVPVPPGQRRTSRRTLADCTCNRIILHPYVGHAPRAPRA